VNIASSHLGGFWVTEAGAFANASCGESHDRPEAGLDPERVVCAPARVVSRPYTTASMA
jgi:hypothetical protein